MVPARRMALPEDGRLRIVYTEDGSGYCAPQAGDERTAIRLSPASAAGSALVPPFSGEDDTLSPSTNAMTGIWLRAGSGQLISFRPNGSYAISDDGQLEAPDDTGMYEIDGRTIGFTSFAPDAACAWRSMRSWDAVGLERVRLNEQHDTPAMILHTEAGESDCPIHAEGDQTWLRVSP
jgi:hypothetical protein